MVVLAVLGFGLCIDKASGWQVWHQLFYPRRSSPAEVSFWSALVYNLVLAMGLPVAFLVWHWRDKNARDQIEQQRLQVENARKDTNLKEFQEVQGRAAGLFDEKMPQSAREQLQIAALHQLRGFLRGEYGDAFRRPAFELILSGHAEAMDRIGMREVQKQISSAVRKPNQSAIGAIRASMRQKLDRIMLERIRIINDEAEAIFESGFSLAGRTWDFCSLWHVTCLKGKMLSGGKFLFANFHSANLEGARLVDAKLHGAHLARANLEGADLFSADLASADLSNANLKGAQLRWAHFESADLSKTNLQKADMHGANLEQTDLSYAELNNAKLTKANFERANLSGARLDGADISNGAVLYKANLEGAILRFAIFDDTTRMWESWARPTDSEREMIGAALRDSGAVHADELTNQ